MENKPKFLERMNISDLKTQKHERYFPTILDESMTVIEKLNQVILYLVKYSDVTEQMLVKWNEVYDWVMNDGLDKLVAERLRDFEEDGTFDRIINEVLLKDINNKVDNLEREFETVKEDLQTEFDLLRTSLTNLVKELTNEKPDIHVQKNEPTEKNKNTFWFEVL